MNETKETIEELRKMEFDYSQAELLEQNNPVYKKYGKYLSHAIQILEAYDQVGGELGEKKKHFAFLSGETVFPVEGFKEYRTIEDWIKFGFNQMHTIATTVVAKKNLRIEELEKEASRIRLGLGDDYGDDPVAIIDTLKKEFHSLKSKLMVENIGKVITKTLCWKNKFVGNSEIGTPKEIINRVAQALIEELTGEDK